VDVVYTWVDGSDPQFQHALQRHAPGHTRKEEEATKTSRFRDSGELRFSLRSLEAHVPWIRRVFLVTNGQVPPWLRRDHPRLRLVTHGEIFRDTAHLPTFNSAAIEAHLHRIPKLSRRFLFLNDDMFFGRDAARMDFLTPDGRPRVWVDPWEMPTTLSEENDLPWRWLWYNRRLLEKTLGPGRYPGPTHAPILFDRAALEKIETQWQEEFSRTSAQRIRTGEMAMPHVLYVHWLAARGGCELQVVSETPYPFVRIRPPLENVRKELELLRSRRPLFFCINDDWDGAAEIKQAILDPFLADYFPTPSSFEMP
jgi:hypothetical protein